MTYAPPEYWDRVFRVLRERGGDLDWGDQWVTPFLEPLRSAGARAVIELGCGTGNDAGRLARAGFAVTGLDYSREAIAQAREKLGGTLRFVIADLAVALPFRDASAD